MRKPPPLSSCRTKEDRNRRIDSITSVGAPDRRSATQSRTWAKSLGGDPSHSLRAVKTPHTRNQLGINGAAAGRSVGAVTRPAAASGRLRLTWRRPGGHRTPSAARGGTLAAGPTGSRLVTPSTRRRSDYIAAAAAVIDRT